MLQLSNAETSPLPRRATTTSSPLRSSTDVGSAPQWPPSITTSMCLLNLSRISSGSVRGNESPGSRIPAVNQLAGRAAEELAVREVDEKQVGEDPLPAM